MTTFASVLHKPQPPAAQVRADSTDTPDPVPVLREGTDAQRALLNILEDFAVEKSSLEGGQRAMLNILDDFDAERARMEGAQSAVLNILDDFVTEKRNLESGQRAMLNILDDFDAEKAGMQGAQRAVLNILEDSVSDRAHLESAQRSMLNILDDFSEEKSRLEETQRAVLNILDDFEAEKSKAELANVQLEKEIEERKRVESQIQGVNTELLSANKELEAFSYSVSHDLRAPLRGIDGFSLALLEDYAEQLDEDGRDYLHRVRSATQRMGILIDDLLNLSRVTRSEMRWENADLSAIVRSVMVELKKSEPEREVDVRIEDGLQAMADAHLLRIVFENLLGNAWKFTSKRECAGIEFGTVQVNARSAFYIRDDGAGFDPAFSDRLFGAFQRLHDKDEFPGTGVGLATVQRIIHRHGGRIWAESAVGKGATFYFTLQETRQRSDR